MNISVGNSREFIARKNDEEFNKKTIVVLVQLPQEFTLQA
jgi:hypothetical protein